MPVQSIPQTEGKLIEVFSSIQGEGTLVGCRQVFVRMACCNLDCAYCDTPFDPVGNCRCEDAPGSGNFSSIPNPVPLETLYNILFGWNRNAPGVHHSISFTGGEPLVQADVLAQWLPALRKILPIYLETNGTLPEALEPLLPHIDWISMDLKLASQLGGETPWDLHGQFLRLARTRNCYVKAVVGEATPVEEVEEAARLMRDVAPDVPLILQPVTVAGKVGIGPASLLQMQEKASRIHSQVRVIPQTHAFIGLI